MPKVLVADNDLAIRSDLESYLKPRGWTVSGAADPQAALKALDSTFDAAILDLEFTRGNFEGIEVLRRIRGRKDLDSVAVVVYTQFDYSSRAVETLRLGAYQYIHKDTGDSLQQLEKALISGMAWQKAHTLRRQLLTTFNPNNLRDQIYRILAEVFQTSQASILFLDDTNAISKVIPEGSPHLRGSRPRFVEKIVKERQPILFSAAQTAGEWDPLLKGAGSLLAVPIFGTTGIVGIIDLESKDENAFDRNWVDVVAYLADLAGLSLEIGKNVQNLALEVRHQFSSPVQVIQMQAGELLIKEIPQLPKKIRDKGDKRVQMILDNANAIEGVCRYLEGLTEELTLRKEHVDIASLLAVCGEEFRPELETKHIRYMFRGEIPESIKLHADVYRLRYSVQCLLKNAIEAIDERRDQELDPEFDILNSNDEVVVSLEAASPDRVTFSVSDTGVGIPLENRGRLFQPLFSTKRRPQTSGVGLFSVKRIIDSHGGRIDFNSELGKGATFRVSLPTA